MAQTYTRQSSMSDGDTITAALFNNEYNQLVNAFTYSSSSVSTTGHRHDGTAGQGGNIHTIGDLDFLNKIVADSTNNRWGFFVEVSSSAVEQIRIQDGAVVPVTDNDIDLGTSSLEFKDAYFDGTVTTDALVADTADINGGSVDGATLGTNSAITQAVIDSININGTTIGHTSDTDLITLTSGVVTVAGELDATTLDISGSADIAGTTNLDIVDIDGAVQIDATVTVGVDDTGYDVKFFGATASAYMLWDESVDDLILAGAARVVVPDGQLVLGSTAVSSTAAELNILDGATVVVGEINALDLGITAVGTAIASKAVILDANKDYTGLRNLTITGELDAATLDISGNVDIDGTLETDALSINGTSVTATAAELNYSDTGSAVGTVVASKVVTVDANKDVASFRNITLTGELDAGSLDISGNIDVDGTTNLDAVDIDGAVQIDNTVTVGADDTGYDVKFFGATASAYMLWDESADDLILAGAARVVVPASGLVIGSTAVTSTAAELNVLDPALKENSSIWIGSDPTGNTGYGAASYNTAIGVEAAEELTTGDYNTAVGFRAGGGASAAAVTSGSNTSVGAHALEAITTGDLNVAIGASALRSNVLGDRNVAVGSNALYAANPASNADTYNVAVGLNAAFGLTTGVQNTFVGSLAGAEVTTGDYNTHVGYNSGGGLSAVAYAGEYNTSIGRNSLAYIRTASNNTALGFGTLEKLASASNNTAVGGAALQNLTSGEGNVAVGGYSGDAITSGGVNTLVGYQSGTSLTTSQYNVAVGHSALYSATTGNLNIALGYKALYDNTVGDRNTAVGYEALRDLEPASNAAMYNVALGFKAGTPASAGTAFTGINNTLAGSFAGSEITSGSNNLFLGKDSGLTGSPGGNITTGSNEIVLGDENISEAHIQVDWTVASDARDKTDFAALDIGLDFVKSLKPVTYKWDKRSKYGDITAADYDLNAQNPDGTHKEDWLDIGFKAQEVEALEIASGYNKDNKTNLVSSHSGDGKQMGLQYSKFVPILVKAVQEQQALIESLTARITTLEG